MISGMILFSRLLGFVREALTANLFTRAETDPFLPLLRYRTLCIIF